MARFYASVIGSRNGTVTKTGTPQSGITAHVRGWNVGVRVEGYARGTEDVFRVVLTSGSNGYKKETTIAEFTEKDLKE